jgi:hypothetical protein
MANSFDKFIEDFADYQIEIEDIANGLKPEVRSTYLALLENPDMRNPDILDSFIDAEVERTIQSSGSEELAAALWGEVAELAELSWSELNEFPPEDRDEIWNLARQMVSAVSMREALIRSGFYTDIFNLAVTDGVKIPELARKADVAKLEKGFDVKTRMSEKRKEQANGNG